MKESKGGKFFNMTQVIQGYQGSKGLMNSKVVIGVGAGIGLAVILTVLALYSPTLGTSRPSSIVSTDSSTTDVFVEMPDNSELKMTIDRPAIWTHEENRDFDKNSITIKLAKTLPASGSLSSYTIVPFNASIHVTNHYMADYVTFNQWQNFTNANNWVTATFDGLNDGDTLFVTVYENGTPVLNLMESGRL